MSETAHGQAMRAVQKCEEYYRTLWNHAVDAELIVNAFGVIRDVNRRTEAKLGSRADQLVGLPAIKVFLEHDRSRVQRLLAQVVGSGQQLSAPGLRVPTESGVVLTVDLDIVPIEDAKGMTEVLLQLTDMTERRQLEQQLVRSERLASLSQFASMFAHDIRNPLAGIKKTLELLSRRQELQAAPLSRWFADLQLTTDLLLGMIND